MPLNGSLESLDNLYPLVDTLFTKLRVKGVEIRGESKVTLSIKEMCIAINFPLKVISSTVDTTGEDIGLLCEIRGDLYLYVFYSNFTKDVEINLIDWSKLNPKWTKYPSDFFENRNIKSRDKAMRTLEDGIVKSWSRPRETGNWTDVTKKVKIKKK